MQGNQTKVAVVLINWRKPEEISRTIRLISHQTYKDLSILIINNGDINQLSAALADIEQIPIKIINPGRNTGFSGACNISQKHAEQHGIDFQWFLNTDTRFPDNCLETLVAEAQNKTSAGILSPIIRCDSPGHPVWVAGGRVDIEDGYFDWFTDENAATQLCSDDPGKLIIPGTAMLVRTESFKQIGPMDEKLFAYHEDVDFSIRAERAGISRQLVRGVDILHDHPLGEPIAPHVAYYTQRNALLLLKKHSPLRVWLRHCYWGLKALQRTRKADQSDAILNARLDGWWDGLFGIGGEMPKNPRIPSPLRSWLTRA